MTDEDLDSLRDQAHDRLDPYECGVLDNLIDELRLRRSEWERCRSYLREIETIHRNSEDPLDEAWTEIGCVLEEWRTDEAQATAVVLQHFATAQHTQPMLTLRHHQQYF